MHVNRVNRVIKGRLESFIFNHETIQSHCVVHVTKANRVIKDSLGILLIWLLDYSVLGSCTWRQWTGDRTLMSNRKAEYSRLWLGRARERAEQGDQGSLESFIFNDETIQSQCVVQANRANRVIKGSLESFRFKWFDYSVSGRVREQSEQTDQGWFGILLIYWLHYSVTVRQWTCTVHVNGLNRVIKGSLESFLFNDEIIQSLSRSAREQSEQGDQGLFGILIYWFDYSVTVHGWPCTVHVNRVNRVNRGSLIFLN